MLHFTKFLFKRPSLSNGIIWNAFLIPLCYVPTISEYSYNKSQQVGKEYKVPLQIMLLSSSFMLTCITPPIINIPLASYCIIPSILNKLNPQ